MAIALMLGASAAAQTTNVFIWDGSGNQVTGTISKGNLFFHDNAGNVTSGTIRNGNVFLNTNKGEITFGTVRDGNVFLTDSKGVTTGTIRNGNIFLNNSDGSVTTGSYGSGRFYTNTSGVPAPQQNQVNDQQTQEIQKQNYEAGYAIGMAAGTAIGGLIHRLTTKQEGLYEIKRKEEIIGETETGLALVCTKKEPKKCRIVEAPMPVQAFLLMESLRKSLTGIDVADNPVFQPAETSWFQMRNLYCSFALQGREPSTTYTNLRGNIENCRR